MLLIPLSNEEFPNRPTFVVRSIYFALEVCGVLFTTLIMPVRKYTTSQDDVYTLSVSHRCQPCYEANGGNFEHLYWIP